MPDPNASSTEKQSLAEEIRTFYSQLKPVCPDERWQKGLEQLAADIDAGQLLKWSGVDLYAVFRSDSLAEAARGYYRANKANILIRYLEWFRNVFVLAPITLTWHALSQASSAYRQFLQGLPPGEEINFLIAWENGMPNLPGWLTFSNVARLDVFLLVVVLVMSFVVHLVTNVLNERIETEISHLTSRWDALLWRVTQFLQQEHLVLSSNPDARMLQLLNGIKTQVDEFRAQGEGLLNLMEAEKGRVEAEADTRQQEIANLTQMGIHLHDNNQELNNLTQKLTGVLGGLQGAIQIANGQTERVERVQNQLLGSLDGLNGSLGRFELVIGSAANELKGSSEAMTIAYQTYMERIEELTGALPGLAGAVERASRTQDKLETVLEREEANKDKTFETLQTAAGKMEGAAQISLDATDQMREQVERLREELTHLVDNIAGVAVQLQKAMNEARAERETLQMVSRQAQEAQLIFQRESWSAFMAETHTARESFSADIKQVSAALREVASGIGANLPSPSYTVGRNQKPSLVQRLLAFMRVE